MKVIDNRLQFSCAKISLLGRAPQAEKREPGIP
jgi:hypothetical protein